MDPQLGLILVSSLFALFVITLIAVFRIKDDLLQAKSLVLWFFALSILILFLGLFNAPHLWYLLVVGLLVGMMAGVFYIPTIRSYWKEFGAPGLERSAEQKELLQVNLNQTRKITLAVIVLFPIVVASVRFFAENIVKNPNIEYGFMILFGSSFAYIIFLVLRLLFSVGKG